MLEAAAGKPTAYDEVTSEKVEYGLNLRDLRHNYGRLGAVLVSLLRFDNVGLAEQAWRGIS